MFKSSENTKIDQISYSILYHTIPVPLSGTKTTANKHVLYLQIRPQVIVAIYASTILS